MMIDTHTMEDAMTATLTQIIDAVGGNVSRDGQSVVIGYGSIGYLRLLPSEVIIDGIEIPAVAIEGRLSARNGGHKAELRAKIRAAGMEIR